VRNGLRWAGGRHLGGGGIDAIVSGEGAAMSRDFSRDGSDKSIVWLRRVSLKGWRTERAGGQIGGLFRLALSDGCHVNLLYQLIHICQHITLSSLELRRRLRAELEIGRD